MHADLLSALVECRAAQVFAVQVDAHLQVRTQRALTGWTQVEIDLLWPPVAILEASDRYGVVRRPPEYGVLGEDRWNSDARIDVDIIFGLLVVRFPAHQGEAFLRQDEQHCDKHVTDEGIHGVLLQVVNRFLFLQSMPRLLQVRPSGHL